MKTSLTGERIKKLREEKNISKEALGKAVGVDRTTIYKYETGKLSKISYDVLIKIANELGTTAKYLNGDTDDKSQHVSDILETTNFESVLKNLFQDESNISADSLYSCTDKEKQFIKKIIQNTHMLTDDDYGSLNTVFDSLINARQVIGNAIKHN